MAKKLTKRNIYNKMTEGVDLEKVSKDIVLEGEEEDTIDNLDKNKTAITYSYSKKEERLLKARKARFTTMLDFKTKLGINTKCDAMDALFTPHLVDLNNPNGPVVNANNAIAQDVIGVSDEPRRSMPLAFEKITTAIAVLIRENPKVILKAFRNKFKKLNLFIENVYYENFKQQSKIRTLQRYTYQLAKYGISYWREYIKRTYRFEYEQKLKDGVPVLNKNGEPVYTKKIVYDINDEVAEVIHPRNIVLDDNCLGPSDPERPARDLFLLYYWTDSEFRTRFPKEKFPKAEYIKAGQAWTVPDPESVESLHVSEKTKIQEVVYENKTEGVRETWVNSVPMESIPLPGYMLSVTGDKWIEDGNNYDGIGIGQVLQIYQPMVDDINNAVVELIRQIVRPVEDFYNNAKVSDESDDVEYNSGSQRIIKGSPGDVVYSKPPDIGAGATNQIDRLMEELERAVMIPKHLSGTAESKTAFEAAQNRETALAKLNIPLSGIKWVLEQAANISLPLFQILYSEPQETKLLKPGDDDFNEALAIYKSNPDDDRVVVETKPENGIYRREFPQMELPLDLEAEDDGKGNKSGTGRIVYSEEQKFWELIPEHFNWKGRIEIVSGSFLPVSKALEDEAKKEMADWLINVPTTDELGRPTLVDNNGKPFIIDKVRAVKERISILRDWDPEKFVVPMDAENADQGNINGENPLDTAGKPIADLATMATGGAGSRPELRGTKTMTK